MDEIIYNIPKGINRIMVTGDPEKYISHSDHDATVVFDNGNEFEIKKCKCCGGSIKNEQRTI